MTDSMLTPNSFQDNPDDPRHGTINGYNNLKCRCDRCRAANTEAVRKWREERPDLYQARRVRAKANRIPRGVPGDMRQRLADERAALSLRQSEEMDRLIDKQKAEASAWIQDHRLQPLRDRLAREEARVAQLRQRLEEAQP